jgi:hypothetical protein
MKKLILHIGFPKCASTTLQESFFFNIQNQDINFLGRSRQLDKSDNYIIGNNLINNQKNLKLDFKTLKEGTNIISDEMLLLPNSLWQWEERGDKNNATFLKKQFKEFVDETIILIVLRKQEDWIYSNYSFNYAKLRERGIYKTFDNLINNLKSDNDLLKEFEFNDWIDPYCVAFGKENLRFLFVEEFAEVNSHSLRELERLFKIDKENIFKLLNNQKNVQHKKDIMTKSIPSNKLLKKLWHLYYSNKVLYKLKPIISKLSFLKKTYKLPNVNNAQKTEVFLLYKQFNKDFAEEHDLTRIMKDLKYF